MVELDGADAGTVQRMAAQWGSLPVRLAMLGLAALRKEASPLWWGYPPGVFIGYKWAGPSMTGYVRAMAEHVRARGYRAYLDVENLDAQADAYFQIPQYIASLQECSFYVLLMTEAAADAIEARKRTTTWIFDEYQHALRLVDGGRLCLVPVLLEQGGLIVPFSRDQVIDLSGRQQDFSALDAVLTSAPLALHPAEVEVLSASMARFDEVFLASRWEDAAAELKAGDRFAGTFDHGFRRMLLAIYTADQAALDDILPRLQATYGARLVHHLYRGYCKRHGIPDRTAEAQRT